MPNDRNIQKKSTGINSKFEHDYSKRYIFMAGALNLTASQEDIKQLLLEYTLQEETIDTRTAQLCIKPSLFLWIRAITAQEEGKELHCLDGSPMTLSDDIDSYLPTSFGPTGRSLTRCTLLQGPSP